MTADPAAPCRPGGGVANPADAFTVWESAEMAAFSTLDQVDVAGRRVLVRLALNVPMKDGRVSDARRIERAAPPVRDLARSEEHKSEHPSTTRNSYDDHRLTKKKNT